jgi:hypothetical protein
MLRRRGKLKVGAAGGFELNDRRNTVVMASVEHDIGGF